MPLEVECHAADAVLCSYFNWLNFSTLQCARGYVPGGDLGSKTMFERTVAYQKLDRESVSTGKWDSPILSREQHNCSRAFPSFGIYMKLSLFHTDTALYDNMSSKVPPVTMDS